MSLWSRSFLKFTLIEWVAALVILLVVARFIWAEEVARFEDGLFESMGLGSGAKYLVTVPLAIWVLYRLYKREQDKASQKDHKLVRPQVLIISFGLVAIAITFVVFLANG